MALFTAPTLFGLVGKYPDGIDWTVLGTASCAASFASAVHLRWAAHQGCPPEAAQTGADRNPPGAHSAVPEALALPGMPVGSLILPFLARALRGIRRWALR